ncbi:hypothetical protein [Kordiimonas marina]|uniref:hypothetical protein n=1 Tax=Kordiimonas marina TaxID=2872312 RepID=UPI001FF45670|nr:hypothetical protein [Kordiimonas marina]MCJ9428652.1 hypothetical protein [Kordiimonas marina]
MHRFKRMTARLILMVVLALAGGATQAFAAPRQDPPAHIYATNWGLTLKADGSGFYNDLARLVLAENSMAANYEILPYRRAIRRFLQDKNACLYPTNLAFLKDSNLIPTTDGFTEAHAVIKARMHVFSRPGEQAVATMDGLAGKTIAYPSGAEIPTLLKNGHALFIPVSDELDKARLLLGNRVDMIVAALPDALFVFRALKQPLPPFAPGFDVSSAALTVSCHATEANKAFLQGLSQSVDALVRSGKLETFLKNSGLEPAAYMPSAP